MLSLLLGNAKIVQPPLQVVIEPGNHTAAARVIAIARSCFTQILAEVQPGLLQRIFIIGSTLLPQPLRLANPANDLGENFLAIEAS